MKVDIGFWNQQGEYIPDIQELNEIERKEVMETIGYYVLDKITKAESEDNQ